MVEAFLLILSVLFFASILSDKVSNRFGVPALLLFLAVGMLLGPHGLWSWMNNSEWHISLGAAQGIGTVALCVILFSGGLDTKLSEIQPVMGPGMMLSTVGVLLTAGITGVLIYYIFGWVQAVVEVSFSVALLMAASMSSTDSASVFSILRTNGVGLKHNLRPLLELESGANDPMAYVLTITMISIAKNFNVEVSALEILQDILVQLVMGAFLGFAFGKGVVYVMRKVRLSNESLYPILALTACIAIFSLTYYLKGNSYLAVYIGGLIIGNSQFTRKRQTKSFFDGLTWLGQLVMFLMLGLMVNPHDLLKMDVWLPCLIISIVMVFISRPLSVFISMSPFKQYNFKDKLFLSWVGLKGAVPIIFAILCCANRVPHASLIFNVVFACTLVSLVVQGTTLSSVAKKMQLAIPQKAKKRLYHFDIELPEEIESSATELEVKADMLSAGNQLKDLNIPPKTLIIMVRRGESFFVPSGQSEIKLGDQLLVITDDDAILAEQYRQQEEAENQQWSVRMASDTAQFVKHIVDKFRRHHKDK